MIFWLGMSVVSLLVVIILILPLRGAGKFSEKERIELNKRVYNDRLKELKAEFELGQITQEGLSALETELGRTLVTDAHLELKTDKKILVQAPLYWASLIVIPLVATGIYFMFPNWEQANHWEQLKLAGQHDSLEDEMEWMRGLTNEKLVLHLRTRVHNSPGDINGWVALAQTVSQLGGHDYAIQAMQKAVQLDPKNPMVRLTYAQTLLGSQDESRLALAEQQIRWVMQVQPQHQGAQAILGFINYRQEKYQQAIDIWSYLIEQRKLAGETSGKGVQMLQQQIAQARIELAQSKHISKAAFSIPVSVRLSDQLARTIRAETVVFLVVRGDDGNPAPVAVKRLTVGDLPINLTLTDSDAMIPGRNMSAMNSLTFVARVSYSGTAAPRAGDFQSPTLTWKPDVSDGLNIVIDKKL